MSTLAARVITVDPPAEATIERTKAAHWQNDYPKGFHNPWPSFSFNAGFWELAKFVRKISVLNGNDPDRTNADTLVPHVKPTFGVDLPSHQIKATWLSHASFLVELPATKGSDRGITILIDPAFSDRCSPFQSFGGNVRYTPPPAPVADLPEIDIVMISHNHYDHCDLNTLGELYKKHQDRPPIMFVGLNGASTLRSTVGKNTDIVEMDWWEDRVVTVEGKGKAKITCTPCQHSCSRIGIDRDKSLWASWAVHSLTEEGTLGASAWHAGDTGYCTVADQSHTIDPALPVCPAFTEIGERLGPFSIGMIPIGAYAPRHLMSPVHNAPIDAVRMFKDTKCKKAIGMHWGTWRMAHDPIAEPPILLVDARKEVGVTEDEFGVVALGETRGYEP